MEELLGEIDDEHDDTEAVEHDLGDGVWRVPARREIRVLNELHGWNLPEADHYDTLGGLLLDAAGDIPQQGALIELDGLSFVVREVEENRISWVEFVPPPEG